MIKKWYNTNGAKAASMIEVNDEFTLSVSNGEVIANSDEEYDNAFVNEDIFGRLNFGGEIEKESMKMGHITLANPVVNIQYFLGRKPMLSKALGIPVKELESIIYYARYVVTEPGNSEFSYKQILSEKELRNAIEKFDFQAMTGAKAIAYLLEKEQVPGRSYMVLNHIPVIPLCMRFFYLSKEESPCGEEHYEEYAINYLYRRILWKNNKLRGLLEVGAPDVIIRNECRLLQEGVDALVNNGARKCFMGVRSYPMDSLNELSQLITKINLQKKKFPFYEISKEIIQSKAKECLDFADENLSEDEIYSEDDPAIVKLEEMHGEIKEFFKPFLQKYMEDNYDRYMSFFDMIYSNVTIDYPQKEDLDDVTDYIEGTKAGMAKQVDFFIKKRLKWEF